MSDVKSSKAGRRRECPPYVWVRRGKYVYRPYPIGAGRKGRRPSIRTLTHADGSPVRESAPISDVWLAYERLQGRTEETLGWLLEGYVQSDTFTKLGDTTRGERARMARGLKGFRIKGGGAFGDVHLTHITPGKLTRYVRLREKQGAGVAGNRELSVIHAAWKWALSEDRVALANPCPLASRNKEKARDRYVTDAEYAQAYALAADYRYLQPAMELAYLCRLRGEEIRRLRLNDIRDNGLETRRVKGSRDAVTTWTERLRSAVDAALAVPRSNASLYVFSNQDGTALRKPGWASTLARWKQRMKRAGMEPFNFHDLKAKGISDFEGDKQLASGHKTPAMVARYDRKLHEVEATR